jgi:hypothetical protein
MNDPVEALYPLPLLYSTVLKMRGEPEGTDPDCRSLAWKPTWLGHASAIKKNKNKNKTKKNPQEHFLLLVDDMQHALQSLMIRTMLITMWMMTTMSSGPMMIITNTV